MESWEDELLWDDDFSDEEEDTEEQIEEADLEMDEDSFADWEDSSDGAPETTTPSRRTRRKKPRPPAKNGSNGKFAQRLCGGWRKQPGRNRIF